MTNLFSRFPIRIKFVLSSVLIMISIALFIFTYYPKEQKKQAFVSIESKLHGMAEMLTLGIGAALSSDNYAAITGAMDWAKSDSSLVYIILLDTAGEQFAVYNPKGLKLDIMKLLEHNNSEVDKVPMKAEDIVKMGGIRVQTEKHPINYLDDSYGTLLLGASLEGMYGSISRNTYTAFFISVAILIFGISLSLFFSGMITKPLKQLREAATLVANGNNDIEIRISSSDEVGALANAFNTMLNSIRQGMGELQKNETKYRSVFESFIDLYYQTDMKGIITDISPSCLRLSGYSPEELIGRPVADVYCNPEERKGLLVSLRRQGYVDDYEITLRGKDGRRIPVSINSRFILDKAGKPIIIQGTIRDITERKGAEREIRQLSARNEALLASVPDIIMEVDTNKVYTWANRTGYEFFGDDVIGKPAEHYFVGEQTTYDKVQPIIDGGEDIIYVESLQRRRDGEIRLLARWCKVSKDGEGRIKGALSTARDITERKRAEEKLQESKKAAEASNRELETINAQLEKAIDHANNMALAAEVADIAKSEFLANMSHEIRTPMNGIIGMTELAMETDLTSEQREYLGMVKTSADNLLAIINDILDFSKIEAGRMVVEQIEFSLRDMVESAIETLSIKAHQSGLELITYIDPSVPDFLLGDPVRLRQIIINLAGNAVKFTEEGEVVCRIELESDLSGKSETEIVRLDTPLNPLSRGELTQDDASARGVILHFSISDTGVGIPLDRQEAIFESFVQADGSTTRKYGGTGLGTTISKQLVEMMGGKIWIESPSNLNTDEERDIPLLRGVSRRDGACSPSASTYPLIPSQEGNLTPPLIPPLRAGGPGTTFHFVVEFALQTEQEPKTAGQEMDLVGLRVLVVDDNETNRHLFCTLLKNWGLQPHSVPGGKEALEALKNACAESASYKLILLDVLMPGMDGFMLAEQIKRIPELAGLKIIVLTSAFCPGDRDRFSKLGISTYLGKPIKQSALLNAIMTEMAGPKIDENNTIFSGQDQSPRKCHRSLHILLAEDNLVNQKLASRLLEKRGHTVVIADNGQEALDILQNEQFDLILMDVQMPVMDGFEATAAIRRKEAKDGGHIPIIALTAHALTGDRELCRKAGMDGYVSKPINPTELFNAIYGLVSGPEGKIVTEDLATDDQSVMDINSVMERVGGDKELLAELAELFIEDSQKLLAQIKEAIVRGDARVLERVAHTLKGSVGNFSAKTAREAALKLEEMGRNSELADVDQAYTRLDKEISRLCSTLQTFTKKETVL